MAFEKAGLMKIMNGGAIGTGAGSVKSIYHYVTNDADSVVETGGYFDVTDMTLGDIIMAGVDLDGTPECKSYMVSVGSGDINDNDVTVVPMLIA